MLKCMKERDKRLHFKWGFYAGLVGGFRYALGVGMGYERGQEAAGGRRDAKDTWATAFGGLCGQVVQCATIWPLLYYLCKLIFKV